MLKLASVYHSVETFKHRPSKMTSEFLLDKLKACNISIPIVVYGRGLRGFTDACRLVGSCFKNFIIRIDVV